MLVLSSPSGGGKTTIARALLEARGDVTYSISATTRPPRPGERDGVDYHFLSADGFQERIDAGDFLEWAEYGGYRYGTLASAIEAIGTSGKHSVLDIEVVGARKVRERLADVVSIFIVPPSAGTLVERLAQRRTEAGDMLERRIQHAVEEIKAAVEYDYVVVNDDRERAVARVNSIIDAECLRTTRLKRLAPRVRELQQGLMDEAQSLQE